MSQKLQIVSFILLAIVWTWRGALGQDSPSPARASPEVRERAMQAQRARAAASQAKPPQADQKKDDKPQGQEKPEGNKPAGKAEDAEDKASTVKRGDEPKQGADPDELKVRPVDGRVSFQFQGQSWPAVIEWFGTISGKAIDWRELPGDYLNIRTQRPYTLDETRDALNRHLLARGFTMLEDGEFLSIEKTDGINTALVPRVAPVELANFMPHSFVKTSFRLRRMMAEEAVKELESMKSNNGKLTALTSTNRIEAMDAVKNLRQIHEVLEQEQDSGQRTLEEFRLDHVRAKDVRTKLEELLGIEKKAAVPLTPQQMQQMQRMQQQRQQQQNKGQPSQPDKKESEISFVVNERRNSIIAQAPPNKMFIIAEAVGLLDVPSNRGNSLESYLGRIRSYRLETLDPEEVANILFETAGLDPSTTLRVDNDSKAIIASAPPWDHLIIEKLVDKLDGSARQFKVVRLRRRQADQVATTIERLMVGKKEEDNSSRRRYPWLNLNNEDEDKDSFRVGADIEHNWLLLWCNENEHKGVMDLLQELGEIPYRQRGSDQVRVIEALPGEDLDAFLRRVQRAFEEIAPNPVELPEIIIEPEPDSGKPADSPVREARDERKYSERTSTTRTAGNRSPFRTTLTQVRRDQTAADGNTVPRQGPRESGPAPVRVERDARGRIVIRSEDTAALDLFEELVERMAPQKPDYTIFTLEYASATWVALKLEDFFGEDEEEDNNFRYPYFFIYGNDRETQDTRASLGDRRKLKFISEIDTNTILVRNATEDQLATIRDLIEIYDIPEPVSTQNARYTKTFKIQYAKAKNIEGTLKDVFRDLLSGNDKAFQQQNQNKENPSRSRSRGNSYFNGFGNDDDLSASSPKAAFKGKLSMGVDEAANVLIVTTEGEKLMELLESMIKELDEAARPTDDVRVVTLPGSTSAEGMREVLARMFGPENVGQVNGLNGQDGQSEKNGNNENKPNRNANGERPAAAPEAR